MQMTGSKIVRFFHEAKNRGRQVEILAQLNACTTGDIVAVLLENGVAPEDIPERFRKGGKRKRKAYHREQPVPPPKRDQKTGKMICAECGLLFEGKPNSIFCADCKKRRLEKQKQRHKQRDRERRAAERAAREPKRCAGCGEVLESKNATYCKACAAARKKESIRKSKEKRRRESM